MGRQLALDTLKTRVEYYHARKTCPICGNAGVETTNLGNSPVGEPGGVDSNDATCPHCAWTGTIHQLRPIDVLKD